jgi:hypothetical protein
MAGLRRLSEDPLLSIDDLRDYEIPHQRPSIGRVRGIQVNCTGSAGSRIFYLVLKEPLGTTRAGTAGVGLREVSVYRSLADQLPLALPHLVAFHPAGEWLVIELTPAAVQPGGWTADHYRKAVYSLVTLHDRYWDLGPDLTIFNWLSRPFDADFDIHIQAAAAGAKRLAASPPPALTTRYPGFVHWIEDLVGRADEIAQALLEAPSTLLHGDYWPGNLQFGPSGGLVVYDWQRAGIGPGVLDLVHLIQSSRWWFDPIPIRAEEIVEEYREETSRLNGYIWEDADWQAEWDYALLWTFTVDWIDLLAAIPGSLIETRLRRLEEIWLDPLHDAAARRRIPGLM